MRIIAGLYKGRKLRYGARKLPVRPMTDKVKETLFNVLSPYFFDSCYVLDLFSGTGSLALEALSRGAGQVHVVEKNPLCIELIKENSDFLKDSKKRLIFHRKNVFSFLKKHLKQSSFENPDKNLFSNQPSSFLQNPIPVFDFVFIDPPFPLKAGDSLMEILSQSSLVHEETVIVIESSDKEHLKKQYLNFCLFSEKDFNDKKLWFYKVHKKS